MTLSTNTNKITYTCNGTTNEFAVPFLFFADSHISVQIKTNDGRMQTLKQDDDYTLSGAGNAAGGTCVLTAAPENGAELLILRDVPYKQETRYIDGDPMPAPLLERNLDALTMMCQQLAEKQNRAVTVDIFDDTQAAELIPSIRKAVSACQSAVKATAEDVQKSTAQTVAATASAANAAASEANTAAMLGTKAEADLSNLSAEGKRKIAALSSPSSAQIVDIFTSPITTEHQSYTAPANGTVMANIAIQNGYMTSDNINTGEGCLIGNTNGVCYSSVNIKVRKGDTVTTYTYQSSATVFHSKFVYDQGEI